MTQWYPFKELGGMYVHTNYESFKSNFGSFGDVGAEMEPLIQKAIDDQIARELSITQNLQSLYGDDVSLQDILGWFVNPDGLFERYKEKFVTAINEEDGGDLVIKFGNWSKALHSDPRDAAFILERMLNMVMASLGKINTRGYLNQDNVKKEVDSIRKSLATLSKTDASTNIFTQVTSIKGYIYEIYTLRFMIEALKMIDANPDIEVILQGRGSVADIVVDLKSFVIPISVKSASTATFMGDYGITLFSGSTIGGIVDKMLNYAWSESAKVFQYYLINISRMKAFPLSGKSASGMSHSAEGLQAIKTILGAYSTVFIGEGNDDQGIGEITQADILITADKILLKSDILRYLSKESTHTDMEAFLKINYQSTNDWEQFDKIKRRVMRYTDGDYAAAKQRGYMTGAVQGLLNQTASVRLRLLIDGIPSQV